MWRQTVVKKWISISKYTVFLLLFDKSGDSKVFVATSMANVATGRIWLDTTGLDLNIFRKIIHRPSMSESDRLKIYQAFTRPFKTF